MHKRKKDLLNPNCCNDTVNDDQRWIPPANGIWKLNCDGSVRNNGREVACGGILRDCYGRFVFAYSQKLDECWVVGVELWSVYHGLSLAWGKGYTKVMVETDSMEALKLIEDGRSSDGSLQLLIDGIKNIGRKAIDVGWSKVDRAFNTCADILAKNSYQIKDSRVIYEFMPDFLVNVVTMDSIGLASPSMN